MVPTVLDLLGIEPPTADPGRHAVADPGRELRAHPQRRQAPRATTTRSTSRCWATARSTTTAGGRCAPGRARPSRRPASGFGEPISADKLTELDAHGWELYHVAEDFAENHNVAAEQPREADRDDRHAGTSRPASTTCCRSTAAGLARMVGEKPLVAAPRDSYTYFPNTQSVPLLRRPKGLEPPAQHHRRRRDPRRRRRGRAALPGHCRRRLLVLRPGRQAALRPQLGRPRALPRRNPTSR